MVLLNLDKKRHLFSANYFSFICWTYWLAEKKRASDGRLSSAWIVLFI